VAAAGAALVAADPASQPFASLLPDVRIDAAERVRLEGDQPIVKVLPAAARELAVVAAVRVNAPPDRLIAWTQRIAALQQGRYVPLIVRFSVPPQLEDLARLDLDAGDLSDLQKCRPAKCGIKLGALEIQRLRARLTPDSTSAQALQDEFRRVVLERAERYLADGDFGLPPYHDDGAPVAADTEVATLLTQLGLTAPHLTGLADYVQWFPRVRNPNVVDSFLYWAKEDLGAKPIASVTHVTLVRGNGDDPSTVSVAKQVFASHYRDGAMSMTAITGSGRHRYLLYVHRSHVDVLQGAFGGLARSIIERRVRKEAPRVLTALRARLEEGDPPQGGANGHAK
jgi:hypothetical protein